MVLTRSSTFWKCWPKSRQPCRSIKSSELPSTEVLRAFSQPWGRCTGYKCVPKKRVVTAASNFWLRLYCADGQISSVRSCRVRHLKRFGKTLCFLLQAAASDCHTLFLREMWSFLKCSGVTSAHSSCNTFSARVRRAGDSVQLLLQLCPEECCCSF